MLSTWEERRMSSFFECCIGTFVLVIAYSLPIIARALRSIAEEMQKKS
jgi:hypothetical protein